MLIILVSQQIISLGRISSNLPIDVLQKALTDGTPVSDVIHSLFQLPPDRQRADSIGNFRYGISSHGGSVRNGEGKVSPMFLSQLLSSLLRTKTEPLWKISTPLTTDSCTIQFISLPKTLDLKIFFQSTTEKLIQNLDTIKHLPQPKLVNYIKTASTNTTYTYLRKRNLDAITPLSGLENEYELLKAAKKILNYFFKG